MKLKSNKITMYVLSCAILTTIVICTVSLLYTQQTKKSALHLSNAALQATKDYNTIEGNQTELSKSYIYSRNELVKLRDEMTQNPDLFLPIILSSLSIIATISVVSSIIIDRKSCKLIQEANPYENQLSLNNINHQMYQDSFDETCNLANSFQQAIDQLNYYFIHINKLAFEDGLTGVHNKNSYIGIVNIINEKIEKHGAKFSVIVFDLNNLKTINDCLGHQVGDSFIITTTRLIRDVFIGYPVFRIGGDEFIVILLDNEYQWHDKLHQKFKKKMLTTSSHNEVINLSIASGIAHYDKHTDKDYNDVFKNADDAMYACKAQMKKTTFL